MILRLGLPRCPRRDIGRMKDPWLSHTSYLPVHFQPDRQHLARQADQSLGSQNANLIEYRVFVVRFLLTRSDSTTNCNTTRTDATHLGHMPTLPLQTKASGPFEVPQLYTRAPCIHANCSSLIGNIT